MANVEDFIFTDDGDLKIFNGDLSVEPSDNQHIQDIFLANKGQFRQYPTIGIGIESKLNGSTNIQFLRKQIRENLKFDNMTITTLNIDGALNIDLRAKRTK